MLKFSIKRVLLLLCIAIVFLVGTGGVGRAKVPELMKRNDAEEIYKVIVRKGIKPFEVRLIYNDDKEWRVVEKIEVYRGKKLLQTFRLEKGDLEPPYEGAEYFQTEDVNFDGYKDMQFLMGWGATGNLVWSFWLYDPKRDRFEFNKYLSDLETPLIDKKKKAIRSWWNGGAAARIYSYRIYKWKGKKLILIRAAEQEFDEEKDKFHKIIKERRNGKMEVVSDRFLSDEEASEENEKGTQLNH